MQQQVKSEYKKDKKNSLQNLRNIGIIAHIDAGKTTTTERILFYAGKTYKIGEVDEGTTTTDWMPQERERGITITSAATTFFWKGSKINLIDTPGHVDFTAEVERTLRVLDGCVVIFSAVEGVESQSETVWRQANHYNVARITFINKMDRIGANFYSVVKEMEKKLKTKAIPVSLPIGQENNFKGIIDLINMEAYFYQEDETEQTSHQEMIPSEYKDISEKYRRYLLEGLSDVDDLFMEKYLEDEFTIQDINAALRRATVSNKITPVFCGSAFKNKGVQILMDGIVDFLPSPLDLPPMTGINPNTSKLEERNHDPEDFFSGLVFKVMMDPYVGRICFTRIYSGHLSNSTYIYNATKNIRERVTRILQMHANHREEIESVSAGDIVALVGLKETVTGDTISDPQRPIIYESIKFPEPVIFLAIEPKSKTDQEKLGDVLRKLAEEDPTFQAKIDPNTGQTIISGMGELHLEILLDRMKREYNVGVTAGKPQVAYKETIRAKVIQEGKYIRQSGGRGQYGHVILSVEPVDKEFEFENKIVGGAIPKEYIPAIEKGCKSACSSGPLEGYPVTGIKITLLDGSFHEVDSSDIAFELAAIRGMKEALKKASPVILEPIMKLEVSIPEENLGDVLSDISARRAKILEMFPRAGFQIIKALVPLSEMFGYATTLRTLTSGRGIYNMQPSHYEEVSPQVKRRN